MLRSTLLIAALLLLAIPVVQAAVLPAGNATIEGIVKDAQTGEALPGAHIVLVNTSLGASGDINGKYVIRAVPAGSYTLRVTYVGYKTVTAPLTVEEGASLKRDFSLTAVSIEGETVVVTAQASGQNAAINQQLSANQITNVVSAARIQELPDANAAESVGRLPGVSVIRDGGEGTQIVIRGLQPKYNTISIDGVRMASSNPNDRSTDLSMISPFSLEGIEVSKTTTADQDADVLGGSVNFTMREAKGEQAGLGYNFIVQGGYNGLSSAYNKYNNYRYVGSIDGRFFDERFGIFAQADIERRNLASNEFGASYGNLGNTNEYITNGLNLNDIARDRQRQNGTLVMDYRLPEGKLSMSNFFSSGSTAVQNRGQFFSTASNYQQYSLAYSNSKLATITNALTLEQDIPIFHLTARVSHAYSETKDPDDWTITFQQAPAGLSNFINKSSVIPTSIPPAAIVDPTSTYLNSLISSNNFSRERAYTGSLDFETNITVSDLVSTAIKFGGKYRYQTRSYTQDQYTGQGLGLLSAKLVDSLIAMHFPGTQSYANTTSIPVGPFLDPGYSYGGFLNGDYNMTLPLSYGMLADMAHFVRTNPTILNTPNDLAYFHDNFNSNSYNYDGHEGQGAFYVMATIKIGPDITFIPGVRYQDLNRTYTAPRGIENTQSALGGPYTFYDTTLTVNNGYWLPDILLRYKPLSWFDVRLSYTNTISYPDYQA
ncbi:MAG TPA: TonB-dependent receptor, partial [Bacteroidota bacterium]|nr:TonB-dependent receptor [Bacteroidota bacterium]